MGEKVLIFGGTSAGTKIAELLADAGVPARLCVMAGFAGETTEPRGLLAVAAKRVVKSELADMLSQSGCELVVDATHPYARDAVDNIREACENAGVERIRLEPDSGETGDVTEVESVKQAADILNKTGERALLAVGSRELSEFTRVRDYRDRLFARVQPTPEAVAKCAELGFTGNHVIGMQGPFTCEMNAATLNLLGATCLVTKDSGRAGGLFEKVAAAKQTGCKLILIRPAAKNEKSLDYLRVSRILADRYGFSAESGGRAQTANAGKRQPFPLFVNLDGKRAVIIGAGETACRRAKTLLKFGAKITAVSPEICPEMRGLADEGLLAWVQAEFSPEHFDVADIVVAASGSRELNHTVAETARRMRLLVNVTDSVEESTYIFPAVVQNENIVVGVVATTGDCAIPGASGFTGANPSGLIQKLREKLGWIL